MVPASSSTLTSLQDANARRACPGGGLRCASPPGYCLRSLRDQNQNEPEQTRIAALPNRDNVSSRLTDDGTCNIECQNGQICVLKREITSVRAISRRRLSLAAATLLLITGVAQIRAVMHEPPGKPTCHKTLQVSFVSWQQQNSATAFPNVAGRSHQSLQTIAAMFDDDSWLKSYACIPGLRNDDPGDLILMYMTKPTRWTWHGERPASAAQSRWLVVPVDFREGNQRSFSGEGERSERLTDSQFLERLEKTLSFIEDERRPNWQDVIQEHQPMLERLRMSARSSQ